MNEEFRKTFNDRNKRVKVYVLDKDGDWSDCGAGILEIIEGNYAGNELNFVQVSTSPDMAKHNPPKVSPELLSKLKKGIDDEDKILYLPILASNNTFESQESMIFLRQDL